MTTKNIQDVVAEKVEELKKAIYATKHFDEIMPIVESALTQHHQDLMSEAEQRGAERERERWINQPANEHDEHIRKEERERILKLIDEHDPSTNRETGSKYWGNTLREALKKDDE